MLYCFFSFRLLVISCVANLNFIKIVEFVLIDINQAVKNLSMLYIM